jgi:hypothetical protein
MCITYLETRQSMEVSGGKLVSHSLTLKPASSVLTELYSILTYKRYKWSTPFKRPSSQSLARELFPCPRRSHVKDARYGR